MLGRIQGFRGNAPLTAFEKCEGKNGRKEKEIGKDRGGGGRNGKSMTFPLILNNTLEGLRATIFLPPPQKKIYSISIPPRLITEYALLLSIM